MPQDLQQHEGEAPTVNLDTSRRSAHEILEEAGDNGRRELARPAKALAFSGLAGGITMGLTGMSVAIAHATLGYTGSLQKFIPYLFYPVGFIAVIIGRAQLFTENTLYPVVLIFSDRKQILPTLRLWVIVFCTNVVGAALFAGLAVRTGALSPEFVKELVTLGVDSSGGTMAHIFWTGVIGGWLIALVAWMVTASHWTIGQIAVVWILTFIVGLGHFAHCIATSGEILSAVFTGQVAIASYGHWLLFATLGNALGGVTFVTLLNFGQVKAEE